MSAVNIKFKKNFISPEWPRYMYNNFTAFAEAPEKEPQRVINVNSTTGISTDNPAREVHPYSEIYYNSPSLWEANPN